MHKLSRENTSLLIIDVQEKLIKLVDHSAEILCNIQKIIKGFQILRIPIVVSEQYPQGLGSTVPALQTYLGEGISYVEKTSFSCLGSADLKKRFLSQPAKNWVLCGIEAHVCVLQTAKDLLGEGKGVVVLNDAISSRSIFNYSTAIAELRDMGARITSTETILFELVEDAKNPEFKAISQLIK